ncbi:gamma-glutamyl kinase [Lacticaseibacillus casei]|uniref:Glutamate 5-kinase n=1 Tax=Lacticaseibacillus zeae TaxID=57037 RepID=A0A5R8LRX2_LACZE|nr:MULTISPECIES: glutamate 5-kinase [Lacticaseibacillus]MDE3283322.1 glutamate 5-kinase [Lacticaseibacillus casei]OLS11575.1 gamma-glutamyl kinase [Lacticaseibacillus casei]QVI31485.1 glutamate 5-kinase [Lacticaseibacillus zeae]TLF39955.1 glutamate 5-kinase [Lacticaseibacillus zeae]
MVKRAMHCKRIVVKIGTSSLIHRNGKVNLQTIDRLAYALTALNNQGYELVLVTSGAIGVGMAKLGVSARPAAIAHQQALAAIGQSELMTLYTQRFSDYGAKIGQLLLTHDVFDYPQTRQHVLDTIDALLAQQVIPIINENDSVAVDELDHRTTFGDNDQLSALVAKQIDADLLMVLSDIDGLYDRDPNRHPDAALIPEITHLSAKVLAGAGGSSTRFGTGGMVTKLKAAQTMMRAGKQMVLASGRDPRIILRIVAGEPVGTWFGNVLEQVSPDNQASNS